LRWHDEGRKDLKKDGKFRHPLMQHNGVTLITTSRGSTKM
jgi:hypothetical protein